MFISIYIYMCSPVTLMLPSTLSGQVAATGEAGSACRSPRVQACPGWLRGAVEFRAVIFKDILGGPGYPLST